MSTLEKVPWMSKDEWEFCRDNLFGENLSMKKKALEHLYVWKVRCTNLPVAVECTLILMDVHLKGRVENAENEEIVTNTMSYESWYSVAIMRFLNLITDSTVGNKAPASMNQLARKYEIPEWIVDIRHAVAHGPLLPNLYSLEKAVEKCLNWLYESYWKKDMYMDSISNQNEVSSSSTFSCFEVCLLIKKYLLFGFESVIDVTVSDREKICRVLSKNGEKNIDFAIQKWKLTEIHEYVLKKLGRHLKKSTDYGKNLICSVLESDHYLFSRDSIKNNELSKAAFDLWSDILFVICDSSICYHFLQELVNIVNSPLENSWRQNCAAIYLNEILKNIVSWKNTTNSESIPVKRRKARKKIRYVIESDQLPTLHDVKLTEEEVLKLIQSALNQPSEYVKIFLKNLLDLSSGCSSKCEKLTTLIDIYLGSRIDSRDGVITDSTNYTIRELIGKSVPPTDEHIPPTVVEDEVTRSNTISESDEWKNTPFGILPWQVNFQPWLDMYNSE